ncbi:hypothetical protein IMZ48_15110 [Candidatus Bathyarchaeota archaeon]|nr:hypothetical protein [Candidatus Bathyarchaeota archaeon]
MELAFVGSRALHSDPFLGTTGVAGTTIKFFKTKFFKKRLLVHWSTV